MTEMIVIGKDKVQMSVEDAITACVERKQLVIAPSYVLHHPAQEITYTPLLDRLYAMMSTMMILHNGVGLAAPQVGLPIQFITVKLCDDIIGMLNPKIVSYSKDSVCDLEGCLSVPLHHLSVARHSSVVVDYTDMIGNQVSVTYNGWDARIIQHEIDHLAGTTILESAKLGINKKKRIVNDLRKLKSRLKGE